MKKLKENYFWILLVSIFNKVLLILNKVLRKNIERPIQKTQVVLQPEVLDINKEEIVPHVIVDFDEDILYVDTDGLNVREIPEVNKNIKPLDILRFGEKVEVIEKGEYWFKVGYRDNKKGWVASQYLTEENPKTSTSEIKRKLSENLPIFKKGCPNLARDENTKMVREIINQAFGHTEKSDVPLQCVEYVQYMVKIKKEVNIDWSDDRPRHGGRWASILKKKNYNVLDNPIINSAMSFTNPNFNKPYGHVAFVDEVSNSDESIKISEANWPSKGIYNERILSKEQWNQEKWGAKFIDFK